MPDARLSETVLLGRVRVPILHALLSPPIISGIRKGWYERDERRAIEAAVRAGDRVLELGGGLGVCSATAASTVPLQSLTIVEANPNLLDAIRLTMFLNKIEEFELVWGAISTSSAKTIHLQVGEHFWAAREARGQAEGTVEVPVFSPKVILQHAQPDVVICDIEGNEQGLIDVADLTGVRSFIVEFHPDCYGMATMERLDVKLLASGFRRATEWANTVRPQVHHYRNEASL